MWTFRLKGVPERVNKTAVSIAGKIYAFERNPAETHRSKRKPLAVYVFNPPSYRWDLAETQTLPDGGPWRESDPTVVAYGHCAYIWYGWKNGEAHNVLYRFNAGTMTWSRLDMSGQVPRVRMCHTACVVGHRVYIFGGWPVDASSLPQVDVLDLNTLQWHRMPTSGDVPRGRKHHSASAIGSRMYVWGGTEQFPVEGTAHDSALFFLDTTTLTWVRPHVRGRPPMVREAHSAFVYNSKLYIFGGYHYVKGRFFSDMYRYNPEDSRWSEFVSWRPGPSPRRHAGCCMIDERVFVFGGRGPEAEEGLQPPSVQTMTHVVLTDMHILDFAPSLRTRCLLTLIDARLEVDRPPFIRNEINAIKGHDGTSPPSESSG